MSQIQRGALYVVATPIGHRDDFSPRARAILGEVDQIAAEDTRTSGHLLRDVGITTPMVSLHEHNETQRVPALIERLRAGDTVGLISDAGTPLISDPGFELVRAARAAQIEVFGVPGPCAAVTALSIAGLPSDQFHFAGFTAPRSAARRRQFEALVASPATIIFYASKRQLGDALVDAAKVFGANRPAAICRELTKMHEQTHHATLGELCARWPDLEHRGEWVLLIGGAPDEEVDAGELRRTLSILLEKLSVRDAAATAAKLLDVPKRDAYAVALTLSEKE
ncbi:MAG: 16S rRNA (cytidine(1402)-2'-O)-methyltransferase [Gammaproteobacteria bacterium]